MTISNAHIHEAEVPRRLAANRPLLLDDTESVWQVTRGRVHVFAVGLRDGEPSGSRTHLLSVDADQLLMGAPIYAGVALLAVGGPETEIVRLSLSRIAHLAAHPTTSASTLRMVETWVQRLSAALTEAVLPRGALALTPDQTVDISAGSAACSTDELCWVRIQSGRVTFCGRHPVSTTGAFPLAGSAWLVAEESTTLSVERWATLAVQQQNWDSLRAFNGFAVQAAAFQLADAVRQEQLRLIQRAEHDADTLGHAYHELAASVTGGADRVPFQSGQDWLLSACQLVGAAAGITFEAGRGIGLEAIVRASRVRHRQVALAGEWWRGDNGPLLGYLGTDSKPVALLPISVGSYAMVDPSSGSRQRVTPQLSGQLLPYGYVFYRSLPDDRPLKARDLVVFAARLIGADLWRLLMAGLAGGLLATLTPILTSRLFDDIIPNADRGNLITLAIALVGAAVGMAVVGIGRELAQLRIESRIDAELESAVWDRLLALPAQFFREYSAGDLATRAMGISEMRQVFTRTAGSTLFSGIFSLFSFLLLFYYSMELALVAVGLLALVLLVTLLNARAQLQYERPIQRVQAKLQGLTFQLLTGIAKLRVAGAEARAFSVWALELSRLNDLVRQNRLLDLRLQVFYSAVPLGVSIVIFGTIALIPQGTLSTGSFLAFLVALGQVTAALLSLGPSISELLQLIPMYDNSRPIFEALPEVDHAKADPGELSGQVQVNHVTFRYRAAGPLIADDISFEVAPGQFVAIVGPSGSGKSTLFRLLLGFESPQSGSVLYDGQDLAHLDLRAVRRQLGVVLQNGKLMPGSIYENIVGAANLTLEDAWTAARMAGLDEDIRAMPMGMQTFLSEGSGTISGGQRQRLMIARAIVNRPRILLFDEATSALDNQTQAVVSRSVDQLKASRIVIAHRLSTVMKADCIYVMLAGRIVQRGTYEQLLREPGPFLDLARRQLS